MTGLLPVRGLSDLEVSIPTVTANYAMTVSDDGVLCDATAGGFTVTLPDPALIPRRMLFFPSKGVTSARIVTLAVSGGSTINESVSWRLSPTCLSALIWCDGLTYSAISGCATPPPASGNATLVQYGDGSWSAPPSGGGSTTTELEVDFGWPPKPNKAFTVVDAGVSPSSRVLVWPSGNAATGQGSDEFEMSPFSGSAVAGSGSFTLRLIACDQKNGRIGGKVKIFYQVV